MGDFLVRGDILGVLLQVSDNGLDGEINAALSDSRMKGRFAELGGVVLPGSPADFGALIRDETEKWGKVIREAKIKVE